jgi:predicted nucleic acid-binding Zn ribbon protein
MRPMRTGLEKIILEALQHTPPQEAPVLAWPFACGPAVANKTKPLRFEGGVLTIEVADSTWRAQLIDMAPQFLGRLNQLVSHKVDRLQFIVSTGK